MEKYVVNKMFDKELFVKCLENLGVGAYIEDNTIYYDAEKLFSFKWAELPHFVYMNLRHMRAQL